MCISLLPVFSLTGKHLPPFLIYYSFVLTGVKVGLMVAAAGTILYNKEKISQLPGIRSRSLRLDLLFLLIAGPISFNMQLVKLKNISPMLKLFLLTCWLPWPELHHVKKMVVQDSQVVHLIPKEHNITVNNSIVCIQAGNLVGAAFYKGRVVHTSMGDHKKVALFVEKTSSTNHETSSDYVENCSSFC